MNAPVLDHVAPVRLHADPAARDRRQVGLAAGFGVLLLAALFHPEVLAAIRTWNDSTAYNHCYMVIPITLYLLWDRRSDLVALPPRPMPAVLLLGLPLAAVWLLAERLGIMEGRQLVAVSFVELLLLALLGPRLWWGMAGPLLYLYFLVPFGEFLTPDLQAFTTGFIRVGLQVLGIPAYIDGYTIEIPQGTFFVAEACAGLRFLIAAIAFGCLYALLMYRTPLRRGLFVLISIIAPIVANGFRGLGIVYLGYLLNSAQAAAADHIIYGWLFFSAVILLLVVLGLPFRQDQVPTASAAPRTQPHATPPTMLRAGFITLATVVIAALSPTLAAALTSATATPVAAPLVIDVGPGCIVRAIAPDAAMLPSRTQLVRCGGLAMQMTWQAFSPRITAAPLMSERRRLVVHADTEGHEEHWLATGDATPSTWRIITSNDPAFAVAVSVWVNGKPVRPGLAMRVGMAMDSLFGSNFAPIVVTLTPAVDWTVLNPAERREAESSLATFLRNHGTLDQTIATLSARLD
ncbi:exosortase A [Rhodopila sp.]|uniref:exosortase A n=1 Tax=Rhodopila sp. TaxID=2480087 RepID=UPI003D12190A